MFKVFMRLLLVQCSTWCSVMSVVLVLHWNGWT